MAWTDPTIASNQAALVEKVLRLYGIDSGDDTVLAAVAADFLDEAVMELNTHLYEFMKTVESSVALTGGTATYELAQAFYRESLAYIVTAGGDRQPPLNYIPYVRFRDLYGDTLLSAGVPVAYTCRNEQEDGVVELGPPPNEKAATGTLTVEYYQRIALPSATAASPLSVPEEVEPLLILGGQKRLAAHLHGPGHADVAVLAAQEAQAIQNLIDIDKRRPDAQKRFVLVDHSRRTGRVRGRLYIEI